MAYSNETSSVKTIVPGAEVSGFCDVVARQKIGEVSAEVPKLSAGEGIGLSTVNGKTVITNKISAGENISLVYDQETNTYRIDGEGGSVEGLYVPLSATECCIGDSNTANISSFSQGKANSAEYYSLAQGYANSSFYTSMSQGVNNISIWNSLSQGNNTTAKTDSFAQGDDISALLRSLAQGFFCRADEKSFAQGNACYAHSSSLAQGQRVSALGASLAQGMSNYSNDRSQTFGEGNTAMVTSFAAGYKCTAANMSQALGYGLCTTNTGLAIGKYNNISTAAFVIGVGANSAERKDAFIVNHDGSVSAAGKISANGVELGAGKIYTGVAPIQVNNTTDQISITGESLSAGPGIDLFSSGGYVVISAVPSNTCCVRFTDAITSVDLSSYLNYDKVTIVHSNDGAADCHLYWDGKTKVFPSGLYCEMVKGTNEQNVVKWSFANSGWINDNWWDWD